MRFLIGWTTGGWLLVFASPAFADEALEPSEVEPNDAVLDDVVGASVNTTAAVAQRTATPARSDGTSPARTSATGAPPICVPDSPRCLLFATTGDDAAWDGQSVRRDVSGPPGTWHQKGRR